MKITKRQLRKLIRETLDTTWPGRSRKFSRPDRKLVREMGRETLSIKDLQTMAQDVVSGASDDYDAGELRAGPRTKIAMAESRSRRSIR